MGGGYSSRLFIQPLLLEFPVDSANPPRKYVIQECVDRSRDKPHNYPKNRHENDYSDSAYRSEPQWGEASHHGGCDKPVKNPLYQSHDDTKQCTNFCHRQDIYTLDNGHPESLTVLYFSWYYREIRKTRRFIYRLRYSRHWSRNKETRNVYSPGSIKINPDNNTPFYTGDNLWQNSRNPIAIITITGCR